MSTNGTQEKSGHHPAVSVQEAALNELAGLIEQLEHPEEGSEPGTVEHYSKTRYRAESYLIAGGGPHAEVYFVFDLQGEIDTCFLLYAEPVASSAVSVPLHLARKFYEGFRRYDEVHS